MKNTLSSVAVMLAVGFAGPALSQETEDRPQVAEQAASLQVIRQNDAAMTCVQVADEAAALSQNMGGQPGGSIFDRLGGVARTGAAMLVPGAGLVMAGADALTKPANDRREAESLAQQNRWYYLNGLYAGRSCHERAEASVPAAPTVPETAPAAVAASRPVTVTDTVD